MVNRVNLTVNEIHLLMEKKRNIRLMSLIDPSKSMVDSLVSTAGINVYNPEETLLNSGLDICKRVITIQPVAHSMFFELDEKDLQFFVNFDQRELNNKSFLINMIELDLDTEVMTALQIADGVLVVVDCINGVSKRTQTALHRAIRERIKPILFMDNLDKALFQLHIDPEDIYQTIEGCIGNINAIIASHSEQNAVMGEAFVHPGKGSVGFGSGLYGWGLTLKQFSEMYTEKFKMDSVKLMDRLWGENFFNPKAKKWAKQRDQENKRSFCMYVLDPIYKVYDAIMNFQKEEIKMMLKKIGVTIKDIEYNKQRIDLFQVVMRSWLPAGEALLQMIAIHLPSPVVAQKYRMEMLYEGPHDDEAAIGVKNCDPEAPLMMYVSKMVPASCNGRYAFGRVFSGVATGIKSSIMGPYFEPGFKKDVYERKIKGVALMMGRYVEAVESVPAGNICGLMGLDRYIGNTGTVTNYKDAQRIQGIQNMKNIAANEERT